jgi:hypothetical protein
MQLIETLNAVEQLLKDQNFPAAPNDGKRGLDQAIHFFSAIFHWCLGGYLGS